METFRRFFTGLYKECYRVEGSGQSKNATLTGSDDLVKHGDVFMSIEELPLRLRFLAEAKWYRTKGKSAKSMAIRKGWLDQCRHEAEINQSLALFAFKMKGQSVRSKELKEFSFYGRDSNSTWVAMPLKHFALLIRLLMKRRGKDGQKNKSVKRSKGK